MAPKPRPVSNEQRAQIIQLYTSRTRGMRSTSSLSTHFGIDKVRIERLLSDAGVWEGDREDGDRQFRRSTLKSDSEFTKAMATQREDFSGPRVIVVGIDEMEEV